MAEEIHQPEMQNDNKQEQNRAIGKIAYGEVREKTKKLLGVTKDGKRVYDRNDSHFHGEGGLTLDLLAEAINHIDTGDETFIVTQVNFDHQVGEKTCVTVDENDDIEMVFRKGRSGRTPMVKNREPSPCSSVVVILIKDRYDSEKYVLITSFIGEKSEKEPWDPGISSDDERRICKDFWDGYALIYNEELVDQERTEAFSAMPEDEKQAELIRERTYYAGIFVDREELHQQVKPSLEKPIASPHITTKFQPGTPDLLLDQIGENAEIYAIGYGNDGKNEGLLVKVVANDPKLQEACDKLETPHITLSISKDGKAVDTAFLDFTPLDKPFKINGTYGLFMQGGPITELDKIKALANE